MAAPALDRLSRAAERCRDADDPDLAWLGAAIDRVLADRAAGETASLDQALGLSRSAALGYRDDRIREASEAFAGLSLTGTAREIRKLARSLQRRGVAPERIAPGDPRRPISAALATGLDFPKERQIVNIINVVGVQSRLCKLHGSNCTDEAPTVGQDHR